MRRPSGPLEIRAEVSVSNLAATWVGSSGTGITAVAIFVFGLNGYAPLVAVVGGVWWGVVPTMLLAGGTMSVAPARMIRWREGAITQRGYQTRIGSWFSKQLGTDGPRPWESAVA